MAFPGGRRAGGEDAYSTAVRELEEEACIGSGDIEVLGYMEPVSPKTVRMRVIPLVALYRGPCPRRLEGSCRGPEVARVALVPVPALLEVREILHPARGLLVYGFKDWFGNVVWGMSLRVLVRLQAMVSLCGGVWTG